MVGTITPVVYGASNCAHWYGLMGIYTLAQTGGAATTGLLFGGAGATMRRLYSWDRPEVLAAIGFLSLIGALSDLKLLPFTVPSPSWQVPQRWKRFPPVAMAACYGFGIGLGVATRIPLASFYVVFATCIAMASIPLGMTLMALLGAMRAVTVAIVARTQPASSNAPTRLNAILAVSPLIAYVDGIALSVIAALCLCQLVRGLFASQ